MPDNAALLAAIAQSPGDDTARLVYADYLEERGDPKAEYVRLRVGLRRRQFPGRAKQLRRLRELEATLDRDWAAAAFPAPKLAITGYRPAPAPVTDPVTKFGGQPTWLGAPQWPISRGHRDRRMQFVCQVAIPDFLGVATVRIAYLFVTHLAADEGGNNGPWFLDLGANDPDSGENAVVLQPGGDKLKVRMSADATGPTLYTDAGVPCELLPEFVPGLDPARREHFEFGEHDEYDDYLSHIWGEKVGGTPILGNGYSSEVDQSANDPAWRLLLAFGTPTLRSFHLDRRVDNCFVFVSADGKRGTFLAR